MIPPNQNLANYVTTAVQEGRISKEQATQILKNIGETALDFTPVVGDVKAIGYDLPNQLEEGDYLGGLFSAASVIPFVGDAANKAYKTYKTAKGYEPENTVKAYKMFREKNGEMYPLFVDANTKVKENAWLDAIVGEKSKTGKVKSKLGDLAYRPGWHAGDAASAQHIGGKATVGAKKPEYRPANQVWAEIEMPADVDWQKEANSRASIVKSGQNKGGLNAKEAHITDQLPFGGYYRYKTNPNMQGNWLISGNMKVNKKLSREEVKRIAEETGVPDLPSLPEFMEENNINLGELNQEAIKELKTHYPEYYASRINR